MITITTPITRRLKGGYTKDNKSRSKNYNNYSNYQETERDTEVYVDFDEARITITTPITRRLKGRNRI